MMIFSIERHTCFESQFCVFLKGISLLSTFFRYHFASKKFHMYFIFNKLFYRNTKQSQTKKTKNFKRQIKKMKKTVYGSTSKHNETSIDTVGRPVNTRK
jgi:hypothetical protein